MDCARCKAPGMCVCPPPRIDANRDDAAFLPFGGIAFAALATAALVGGPRSVRATPRPKKRNPKREAQKAQRAARKKTRGQG